MGLSVYYQNTIEGSWISYTPSWTNLTIGNGTQNAAYIKWGNLVIVRGRLVLGSTSSIAGDISHVLPFVGANITAGRQVGTAVYEDAGTRIHAGMCSVTSASQSLGFHHSDAGNAGNTNGTTPFTFGSGDCIYWQITYESG